MKRLGLAAVLICSAIVINPTVQAQGASRSSAMAALIREQVLATRSHLSDSRASRAAQMPGGDVHLHAPANQTATQMRVDPASFSPATVGSTTQDQGTLDAPTADTLFFSVLHASSFESLGFVTGYYEQGFWTPPGSSSTFLFPYQGSVYNSSTAAAHAWNDAVTHTQSQFGTTSVDCTSQATITCAALGFSDGLTFQGVHVSDGYILLFVLQYNQCTAEVAAAGDHTTYTANQTQVNNILASVTVAAVSLLKSVCVPGGGPQPTTQPTTQPTHQPPPTPLPTLRPTPPPTSVSFNIVSLRIEKVNAKADWNQVRPPLTQIKAGSKVKYALYYTVTSAPANEPIVVDIVIRDNGKTLINQEFNQGNGCTACHLDATNPADSYRFRIGPSTLTARGRYSAKVTLSIGSRHQQDGMSFTVVPRVAPPPPPVSFSFDRLQTINGSGRPAHVFRADTPVGLTYTYTVRNLRTTERLIVRRAYQRFSQSNGWVALGHIISESGDTNNGTHTASVSSVPNPSYSSQRIIVGITVGGSTVQKTVAFKIR